MYSARGIQSTACTLWFSLTLDVWFGYRKDAGSVGAKILKEYDTTAALPVMAVINHQKVPYLHLYYITQYLSTYNICRMSPDMFL